MPDKTTFVVVQTGTNRDHRVFGPFKNEDDASEFRHAVGSRDHLHEFEVHEVTAPDAIDEEE